MRMMIFLRVASCFQLLLALCCLSGCHVPMHSRRGSKRPQEWPVLGALRGSRCRSLFCVLPTVRKLNSRRVRSLRTISSGTWILYSPFPSFESESVTFANNFRRCKIFAGVDPIVILVALHVMASLRAKCVFGVAFGLGSWHAWVPANSTYIFILTTFPRRQSPLYIKTASAVNDALGSSAQSYGISLDTPPPPTFVLCAMNCS